MEQITATKNGSTKARWVWAIRDTAFDSIRNLKLIETNADHFLAVLKGGTVSTNVYLRRIHNYAMNMHWLPWPILPRLNWPKVQHREKRAITLEEHQKIIHVRWGILRLYFAIAILDLHVGHEHKFKMTAAF